MGEAKRRRISFTPAAQEAPQSITSIPPPTVEEPEATPEEVPAITDKHSAAPFELIPAPPAPSLEPLAPPLESVKRAQQEADRRLQDYPEAILSSMPKATSDEILLAPLPPTSVPLSHPTPSLKLEPILFYEWGTLPYTRAIRQAIDEGRRFRDCFSRRTTHYILFEIRAKKVLRRWNRRHPLVYRYYHPDGSLLIEDSLNGEWKSISNRSYHSWGWGWDKRGQWKPGTYRVDILIDGVELARGSFTIE